MNKKGNIFVLLFVVFILALVIFGSLALLIGSGIATFMGDTINSVTSDLGVVGDTNMSQVSDVTIGTVNEVVQMLKWGAGFILALALIGVILFAGSIRLNPSPMYIGFYIILMIVLLFISIFVSNIYEEFHNGTDEIAIELQEMPVASFIVLYMPHIITILGFIGGLIIFSGIGEETV